MSYEIPADGFSSGDIIYNFSAQLPPPNYSSLSFTLTIDRDSPHDAVETLIPYINTALNGMLSSLQTEENISGSLTAQISGWRLMPTVNEV